MQAVKKKNMMYSVCEVNSDGLNLNVSLVKTNV